MLSTTAWDENRLVVNINTTYSAGNKVQVKQVWSLDASGRLNIELTDHVGTASQTVTTLVYKKSQTGDMTRPAAK